MATLILNSTQTPVIAAGQLEFNTDKNTLVVGNGVAEISMATTGSNTFTGNQVVSGSINVTGRITANEFYVTYVTASAAFTSGSTKFGDTPNDIHQFTGSVEIDGDVKIATLPTDSNRPVVT